MKEFLLSETKIIAIVESRIEKWFSDPEINTVITIVEKCSSKKERDNNEVSFVSIKKPLKEVVTIGDFRSIDAFISQALGAKDRTNNEIMRVIKRLQKDLVLQG